jgi:hypothetical protein
MLCSPALAQALGDFGTIKGRVIWSGRRVPARNEIKVGLDTTFILKTNLTADLRKGTILDGNLLINPGNRGVKEVLVWLLPSNPNKPLPVPRRLGVIPMGPVVVYTHAGTYRPHAVAMRQGQVLIVKNSDAIGYATRWDGDPLVNPGGSTLIGPGKDMVLENMKAQRLPLRLECMVHGWMKGRLGVFHHPYYAITDVNGDFEIKYAPVGEFRLMIYHEQIGYRPGAKSKNGEPVTIKSGVNDLGQLPMGN